MSTGLFFVSSAKWHSRPKPQIHIIGYKASTDIKNSSKYINHNIYRNMDNPFEKMLSGERYTYSVPEVEAAFERAHRLCASLQGLTIHDSKCRLILEELIPGLPASASVSPPFHCDLGSHIRLGEGVFVNFNAVMLDTGGISIGNHTLIGPNCSFYTPRHPMDYLERREPQESAASIRIGDDCWLGGNVTVCPGVSIGSRTIVGAGSVVVHDLPSDVVAVGNPARIVRHL